MASNKSSSSHNNCFFIHDSFDDLYLIIVFNFKKIFINRINIINFFVKYNDEHINPIKHIIDNKFISLISKIILDSTKKNNKILICGNGGSASDSNHISAEFVENLKKKENL